MTTAKTTKPPPQEVRIIGGRWKRSKLPVAADVTGLRPTPGRVRETLFNWLGQDLTGWRCLDAFAGSGALGFEAASRGATEVVLVERDRRLAANLTQTRDRLQAGPTVRVECADALGWMARAAASASFNLVFIDPPFDSKLAGPALQAAVRCIGPNGLVYFEAGQALDLTADGLDRLGLRVRRQGRAGAVHFHLLQAEPAEPPGQPVPGAG